MDIAAWLRDLGLERYEQAFRDNEIDAAVLPSLTAEDLKDLGVTVVGHRRKLLDAAAALRASPDRRPDAAARLPEGERRQVTVVFADLCGFTQLASELGPEATHRLLNRFFEAADAVVETYGGSIDKHIGDNVMAVFGAPVAHDNDPERAVRAALDIHAAVARLGQTLGRRLEVHIGIASGEVVASGTGSAAHRHYTVTGETVNLASRLQDMARAGDTLISDGVFRALAGRIDCHALGDVEVRGLRHPIPVWRLEAIRREPAGSGPAPPFVGRRAELHQCEGLLKACGEGIGGHVVYIRGEAGIGKSRLVQEFQAMASAAGFACHAGHVLDFGAGEGRDAIRGVVRSMLSVSARDGGEARAARAAWAVASGLVAEDDRVFLNDLLDLPQPTALHAIYNAMDNATRNRGKRHTVGMLLRRLAEERPVFLRIEDLHWADPVILAHVAELARHIAACPAILVMTSRIEGDPLDTSWRGVLRGVPLSIIDLGPLREREAAALAEQYADRNQRFVATCIERAQGNPLFLDQLLRSAEVEHGERLPGSVQSLVLARMDRLAPLDRQAMQAAAVIGQRFTLDLLRHLVERADYDCERLVAAYLIRPEGEDFVFAHALVRDGVYGSLLDERRHDLHRRAAAWFAARDPVLHARHLDRAADAEAPRAYLAAADAQAARNHDELALELVDRGLALAAAREDRFQLLCRRGDLLHALGAIELSIEAYRQAAEIAEDDRERCRAWIGQVAGMRIVDRYDDALRLLERAEAAARDRDLPRELAQIHYHRGNILFPRGDTEGLLAEHQQALACARRAQSPELEALAQSGLGDAYYSRGRLRTAHDMYDRCIALSREHAFGPIEVGALHMRGLARHHQFDIAGGRADRLAGAEMAARIGNHRAEMIARLGVAAGSMVDTLDLDLAREQAERGLDLARRLGARRFEPLGLMALARCAAADGETARAVELAQQAVTVTKETGPRYLGPWALGVLARLAEDPGIRRQALAEGEALLSGHCSSHNYLQFYREAMEVSLRTGAWDRAEDYAARLEAYTRAEPLALSDFFIARARALAAFGRGRRDAAVIAELRRLRDEAARGGLRIALAALDEALANPAHPGAHQLERTDDAIRRDRPDACATATE